MRVWDLPVGCLCRNHLLAEHRELGAIWSMILQDKRGHSRHPEVMRWRGRLLALRKRHVEQVGENECVHWSEKPSAAERSARVAMAGILILGAGALGVGQGVVALDP